MLAIHMKPSASPRGLGLVGALVIACLFGPAEAQAQAWSLNDAQRQAYLHYYAPIVLKRANANNDRHGYDWITNFDFDQDGDFSNNKLHWKNIPQYINASRTGPSAYDRWRIRPTLYTSLIEFMDGGKNLVLIYHIYHALDKNAAGDYQLHDWERVELLVKNVVGAPGSGESVAHAVVTQHKRNVIRRYGNAQLNFMSSPTGNHLLIWQAEWSDKLLAAHGQELRFVTHPSSWIADQMAAGAKAEAAVLSGVRVGRIFILCHMLSGALAAVTALMVVARNGAAIPSMAGQLGQDWLLPAFLGPVLGGTLLTGGRVAVLGTFLGAALVTMLTNGLLLLQIGEFWVQACLGLLLLAAVLLDKARRTVLVRRGLV
jgi:hypothetical protein